MKRLFSRTRLAVVLLLMFAVFAIYIVALYDMQVVHGAAWSTYAENHQLMNRRIEATRGRILDRNEQDLVSNRATNHVMLDWVTFSNNSENPHADLLRLVRLAEEFGYSHTDTLAITSSPFQYTEMTSAQAHHINSYITWHERRLRNAINQMSSDELFGVEEDPVPEAPTPLSMENVSAVQLMAYMRQFYAIDPAHTAEETRILAGIRFEIAMRSIVGMDAYIFIEDAGVAVISALLEQGLPGLFIQESSIRRFNTTGGAHIIGRVGPITAEDIELELFAGYPFDAQVGRDGLERDFEQFLQGSNGRKIQTVTAEGVVIGERIMQVAQPGSNAITTIDIGLQAVTEAALRSTIRQINAERADPERYSHAGAAVAIDPRNGEVLAIASTPGFSLEHFSIQFPDLVADEVGRPLLNRATAGVYSPGSTFKMVTAMAALYHGMISEHTTIFCDGAYREWQDQGEIFRCMGNHGYVDLREALAVSCNVYFFQLSRWLGWEIMDDFAARFGLGELTGIGFGEQPGQRSDWDNMLALNHALRPGDPNYDTVFDGQIIQIGIGQAVSQFTPIQLANFTAMIASGGIRFQPTLLREIRSYDGMEVVYIPQPVVLADFREEFSPYFIGIQEGMLRATTHGTGRALANFRVPVASKTGTVEVRAQDADGPHSHGVFVAYAPMQDPTIAIAVVIEHGGSGSAVIPVATAMLDHFFQVNVISQGFPLENVLLF